MIFGIYCLLIVVYEHWTPHTHVCVNIVLSECVCELMSTFVRHSQRLAITHVVCMCVYSSDRFVFFLASDGFVQSVKQSPFSPSLILFWLIFSTVVPFIFLSLWLLSSSFCLHSISKACVFGEHFSPTFCPFDCNCLPFEFALMLWNYTQFLHFEFFSSLQKKIN